MYHPHDIFLWKKLDIFLWNRTLSVHVEPEQGFRSIGVLNGFTVATFKGKI